MDIVTPGLHGVYRGLPLFLDATCVSALDRNGNARAGAAARDGALLQAAERRNRRVDYPDVEASPQAQLLCLGVESHGRWSEHCLELVKQLARRRASGAPAPLRRSLKAALAARWWGILSVGVQSAVAEGVIRDAGADLLADAGLAQLPPVADVLDEHRG